MITALCKKSARKRKTSQLLYPETAEEQENNIMLRASEQLLYPAFAWYESLIRLSRAFICAWTILNDPPRSEDMLTKCARLKHLHPER